MARITIEVVLEQIPNRFDLALSATYRARQLAQGSVPKIETKDKPTVAALREIAGGHIGLKCSESSNLGFNCRHSKEPYLITDKATFYLSRSDKAKLKVLSFAKVLMAISKDICHTRII